VNGIQRQRTYLELEVDRIVRASEVRASRRSGQTGHVGSRHVLITNDELAARADEFVRDAPLACAFSGTPEAITAVTEALNSVQGQEALGCLDANYPTGIRVRIEARVASPIRVRYSSGYDIVRKATIHSVLVLVERIEEEASFGVHIHTAFPILGFRRGQPAWLDHQTEWH
jgi:hypothetical protein